MPVLTVLSHGTANSTNTNTSEGCVLVISKLASLMTGRGWMLNEGAGTAELRATGVWSPTIGGIGGGSGVEANVRRSVDWVKQRRQEGGGAYTLNLVGHSRGSITCYKIARALCDDADPAINTMTVNIFAIDPVPGNTGHAFTSNGENYKNIILGGNVWRGNSFLLLAESEHRLVFRPYVDALYSVNLPKHKFDTIPGTHGGINMLDGPEHEAADIVLSRALSFLRDHDSEMDLGEVNNLILAGSARLDKYAQLMCRIKKYKARATVNPFRGTDGIVNFAMSGFQVERHRIANVVGSKGKFGETVGDPDRDTSGVGRKNFHGSNLGAAIDKVSSSDGDDKAHASRPHRFFCNLDHQELFRIHCQPLYGVVRQLERSDVGKINKAIIKNLILGAGKATYDSMLGFEKIHFDRFIEKRGIDLAA